jgi:biopolymer transport protein TolR
MAVSVGGGGRRKAMSNINITPLVDVMLVLLVIFMVTAPMMSASETKVALPRVDTGQTLELSDKDFVLMIGADKGIRIRGCKGCITLTLANIVDKLKGNKQLEDRKSLYLFADRTLKYRYVLKVMAKIREAGIPQVGLVTNPGALKSKK